MVFSNIEAGYKEVEGASVVDTGCAGMGGYNAEMIISRYDGDNFKNIYVTVSMAEGTLYMVSRKSFLENIYEEAEIIEEYESMEDTKRSEYAKYFPILEQMIDVFVSAQR
ncbi:hypothetical protein [Butyrivibrio sp. MB2005]|uniref:hypothetical protein n=1 Tax=Butyrivibrio sp. MB2005 TaxID=1280678 RepID=UPI00040F9B6C|nr:hypothetical protein [Butyrivibrio sp. MB2005]